MDDPNPEEIAKPTREHFATAVKEATQRIEELANSVDAARLFVAAIGHLASAPEGTASELTHGTVPAKVEALAYCLFPYFGASDKSNITPWQMDECLESLDQLVNMRLMGRSYAEEGRRQNWKVDSIATLVRLQAEIVRGSAYPEQTSEEISEIQGRSDSWFARAVGISPTRAKDFLWAIIRYHEYAINDLKPGIRAKAEAVRKLWLSIKQKPVNRNRPLNAVKKKAVRWMYLKTRSTPVTSKPS